MKTSPQLETSPVKELVRAGHELAAAMGADTPLIEIAKLVSRLATALDVQHARTNTLVAENAGLKESRKNLAEFIHEELDAGYPLNMNIETPTTDTFLAEVRAQGVEMFAEVTIKIGEEEDDEDIVYAGRQAVLFAAQLRKGGTV